jgi:hypothetical protein
MNTENHGRRGFGKSRNPYTCGLTGKTYNPVEVKERVDFLSRAIAKRMGWKPNEGTPWDKVIAIFSFNTVSTSLTLLSLLASGKTAAIGTSPGSSHLS